MEYISMAGEYIPAFRFKSLNNFFDKFLSIAMRERFIKSELIIYSGLDESSYVLDFGCGTGTLIKMILEKYPGIDIVGIDIDPGILQIAREKLNQYGASLVGYDGITIPFSDGAFDIVVTSLAIHHISTDRKVPLFRELNRILKPDGRLSILDFAIPNDVYSTLITSFLRKTEPIGDNIEGKIPGMLREAGFNNINQTGYYKTMFGALTILSGKK